MTEGRRVVAELLGTAVLLSAIVGSGISASVDGPASLQLFAHAAAVGAALAALIAMLGPVSGAHLNPVVTAADWWFGGMPGARALRYVAAQLLGGVLGTVATNLMFGLRMSTWSGTARDGAGLVAAEALATAGLLVAIFALVRTGRVGAVAGVVGAWIGAAVFFTSSTALANPAVTLARTLTATYTGVAPGSAPGLLLGQLLGGVAAVVLVRWLYQPTPDHARDVVVPQVDHPTDRSGDDATDTSGDRRTVTEGAGP